MTVSGLRVLVADEDHSALEGLSRMLGSLGHEVTSHAIRIAEVADKVAADDPDISIVVVHEDDDHALALIDEIGSYASGPVIALTQRENPEFVAKAAELGIAAYGRPWDGSVVQSAIEVALRRHAEVEQLTEKIDELEGALQRRSLIERAKGILMERHSLADRAAFERLRTFARANQRRVVDVARDVAESGFDPPAV
jgi:AmiR/NasT family two-component response regulator